MHQQTLHLRIIGFVASLLLTLTAYFIVVHPEHFHLNINMANMVIFILAILQAIVQLIFFIDIWDKKGPPWNLGVFVSTISVIVIIIFFSIWIMENLNYNMMPWLFGSTD
jgi:cytochrome o ubiquinol oxidase operon protein cyoD